jgi:hypothetical protein
MDMSHGHWRCHLLGIFCQKLGCVIVTFIEDIYPWPFTDYQWGVDVNLTCNFVPIEKLAAFGSH